MNPPKLPIAVIIAGPTASGKSGLALVLAEMFDGTARRGFSGGRIEAVEQEVTGAPGRQPIGCVGERQLASNCRMNLRQSRITARSRDQCDDLLHRMPCGGSTSKPSTPSSGVRRNDMLYYPDRMSLCFR